MNATIFHRLYAKIFRKFLKIKKQIYIDILVKLSKALLFLTIFQRREIYLRIFHSNITQYSTKKQEK